MAKGAKKFEKFHLNLVRMLSTLFFIFSSASSLKCFFDIETIQAKAGSKKHSGDFISCEIDSINIFNA